MKHVKKTRATTDFYYHDFGKRRWEFWAYHDSMHISVGGIGLALKKSDAKKILKHLSRKIEGQDT